MPYFSKLNILFIHIPKTGGTSIEKYFEELLNIKLSKQYLYSSNNEILNGHSLQHLTYNEIYNIRNILDIDFYNIKIITIVRNPYERIISELFYQKMININSTKKYVMYKIYEFLNSNNTYDNHKIPQYKFIVDSNNKICNKIIIFRTENLTNDMKNYGFNNFNFNENKNKYSKYNYYNYLNNNSIKLINSYYDKDFTLFSYNKIDPNITINEHMKNINNNNFLYYYMIIIIIIIIIIFLFIKLNYSIYF
jgi:hypothetical protein